MNTSSSSENNGMSICIPRAFANINEARVRKVFDALGIFSIARVDMVQRKNEKGDEYQRIFVHIKDWTTTVNAQKAKERLLSGKELKIVYDDPWFWKASLNTWAPKSKPDATMYDRKPRIRLEFDDEDAKNASAACALVNSLTLEDRRPYRERRLDPVYCEQDVKSGFRDRRETKRRDNRDRKPRSPSRSPPRELRNLYQMNEKKEDPVPRFSNQDRSRSHSKNDRKPRSPSRSPVRNDRRNDRRDDRRIKITPDNVDKYIGYQVVFKNREGKENTTTILGVSQSKKTIHVDFPELKNNLEIVSRNIYLKDVITSEKLRREEKHEFSHEPSATVYQEKKLVIAPVLQEPVVNVVQAPEIKYKIEKDPEMVRMICILFKMKPSELTDEIYSCNAQRVRDIKEWEIDIEEERKEHIESRIDYAGVGPAPKKKNRKIVDIVEVEKK